MIYYQKLMDLYDRYTIHKDMKRLENEAIAWAEKRNVKEAKVDWRFTTEDARIKLKKLYPSLEEQQTTSKA